MNMRQSWRNFQKPKLPIHNPRKRVQTPESAGKVAKKPKVKKKRYTWEFDKNKKIPKYSIRAQIKKIPRKGARIPI